MANYKIDSWQEPQYSAPVKYHGIYEESSTQQAPLGYVLRLADGRAFRYAKNGAAALVAGKVVQGKASAIQCAAAGGLMSLVAAKAGAANDTSLSIQCTTTLCNAIEGAGTTVVAANRYKDGYLIINNTTGSQGMYRLAGNDAATAKTGTLTIKLADPLRAALTTTAASSGINLILNPYYGTVITAGVAGAQTAPILGVPPIAVTANYYYWLQTYGPCMVLFDAPADAGAINSDAAPGGTANLGAPGAAIQISRTTAGAVQLKASAASTIAAVYLNQTHAQIGYMLTIATSAYTSGTYFLPVFLTLAA